MCRKLKIDERQTLIKHFNSANSETKLLLESTRACIEGFNFVKKVVSLDIVEPINGKASQQWCL